MTEPTSVPSDSTPEDAAALLALLQDATKGEYTIDRELGRGGMAAVFLAHDASLNRKVAIKTMLPELTSRHSMVARFKREAQTAAGLSHPHIIQIFSVRETKQLVYFVMKFIEGRSLDSIIATRGALDIDTARLILQQAGSALSFAHHRNVVHRDVKPANIMIDENGWAVVTDFGIAKLDDGSSLTATGTTIGTPHYMAPEQFHNKPATGQSDQYSLGIVAYETLTGTKPFDGGSFAEIVTKQLFNAPPDLRQVRPDIPEQVSATIARMLSKEPADRFPDLDSAIAAFGHPAPDKLDAARGKLVSMARSGEARAPRLSVPMSPVPITRPSAPTSLVSDAPKTAPRPVQPAEPTLVESRPQPASPAPPRRSRAWIWIAAAVVVLAVPAFLVIRERFPIVIGSARRGTGYLDRGVELFQQGQPAAAKDMFERAAREMPNSATPHLYLSRIARESGDLPTARQEAATAVRLEPDNALALREMGSVMLAAGSNDMARRFFVRSLRSAPGDRLAMAGLACALERMGDAEQSARWRQRSGGASCAR